MLSFYRLGSLLVQQCPFVTLPRSEIRLDGHIALFRRNLAASASGGAERVSADRDTRLTLVWTVLEILSHMTRVLHDASVCHADVHCAGAGSAALLHDR